MKTPLRYQVTEYDCGPTSLLNAVSFLPPMPLWGCAVTALSGLVLTGLLWKQEQRQAP